MFYLGNMGRNNARVLLLSYLFGGLVLVLILRYNVTITKKRAGRFKKKRKRRLTCF